MQQQTNLNPKTQTLSPIDLLIENKKRLQERCRQQEKKLNEDFAFIQGNASSLFLSGMSALLFSSNNSKKATDGQVKAASLSTSDYLSITKSLIPAAWEIAQPILVTWGIKKAKNWFYGLFSRKKKRNSKI